MANDSPRHDYQVARERLNKRFEEGKIPEEDYDLITEFLDAFDDHKNMVSPPRGESAKEPSTLKSYCSRFTWASVRMLDSTLAEATTNDINRLMDQHASGNNPHIKDGGYADSTVRLYQSALRSFYQYHDNLDVEPEEITLVSQPDSKVDERDMFTPEEIERLRSNCKNPRDRCLLELLINTGQRIRAIQTLRIKDVNLEEGVFYLNDTADGLKHAEGKRPLLGAKAAVRRYLDYHPCPNDPEAYLLTQISNNNPDTEPGDMLHRGTLRRRLKKIAERADVSKKVHPHNFRHYFVTIAKKRYGLDNDQIRWLIGHGPDSAVMETTYSHLTDDDRIKSVEVDAGYREPEEDDSPLTPPACPTCGEPLGPSDKACSSCGEVFTPDAKDAKNQIEADMKESYKEAGRAGDSQGIDDIEDVDELLEDPAIKKALIEKLQED
jgi:site-specific recombinase XerD